MMPYLFDLTPQDRNVKREVSHELNWDRGAVERRQNSARGGGDPVRLAISPAVGDVVCLRAVIHGVIALDVPVVYDVVDLTSGRWVLPVMVSLEPRPLQFMDLLRAVNDRMGPAWPRRLSERVLSDTLRRLELAGLVLHQPRPGIGGAPGPYMLVGGARSLLAAMTALEAWAADNRTMLEGIRRSRHQPSRP
jgi:DNA-binding HxlR family transcriptional regulator